MHSLIVWKRPNFTVASKNCLYVASLKLVIFNPPKNVLKHQPTCMLGFYVDSCFVASWHSFFSVFFLFEPVKTLVCHGIALYKYLIKYILVYHIWCVSVCVIWMQVTMYTYNLLTFVLLYLCSFSRTTGEISFMLIVLPS